MRCIVSLLVLISWAGLVRAGIDHPVEPKDSGVWSRSNQNALRYGLLIGDVAFAVWEGGETRLGRSAWQSIDSVTLAGITAELGKRAFGRLRPTETDDPNQWFQGGHSFPSGEVAEISGIVTPYVFEYAHDHPGVWALELLPAYDAIARVRVGEHWQTDVIAGWALGTATGYLAYKHESPVILGVLPHGFTVGLRKQF